MKQQTCKLCGSVFHTKMYHKERKPIKRTAIKKHIVTGHEMVTAPKKPRVAVKKRKPTTKPKKAESRSKVVKKLDDIYSKYVRLDKSDEYGYASCVTCTAHMHWTELQNGHFISRSKYPTRWHDDNCFPQCMRCNVFLKGNYIPYTLFMVDSYTREGVEELKKLSQQTIKISTAELKEKIAYYSTEVERLKAEKRL